MPVVNPAILPTVAVAGVCWALTLYKLRDLARDPRNDAQRYLILTLVAMTLSISVQPVAHLLDRASGVLDLGRVLANCLVVAGVTTGQALLLHLAGSDESTRRRVRWRMAGMLGAVLLIATTFALTPPRLAITDPYVVSLAYYAATPSPAALPYQSGYLAYLAWAVAGSAVLSHRYAGMTARPLVRLGLRLVVAGCWVGLAYVAVKLASSLAVGPRPALARRLDALIPPLYTLASATVLVGATLPSWGRRLGLDRLWNDVLARRDCHRLEPLWRLIHAAVPEVILRPHPAQPALRRIRMTIEILDGYVLLGPWTSDPGSPGPPVECRARLEASVVVAAARRFVAGERPGHEPAVVLPMWTDAHRPGDVTAAGQVAWLARVAREVRRLPRFELATPAWRR